MKDSLLQLAAEQQAQQARLLAAWQHALYLAAPASAPASTSAPAPDVTQLFKTVSRAAVQNLSPSSPATPPRRADLTPTETERDLDDLDNYSSDDGQVISKNSTDWIEVDENVTVEGAKPLEPSEDLVSEVLGDSGKVGTDSLERSSKSDVVSDPLREFSEIDLRDTLSDVNLNE